MKIKFKTFAPYWEYENNYRNVCRSAATQVNDWLEENPKVEIISWQTTAVGDHHELYITIQYKEPEED